MAITITSDSPIQSTWGVYYLNEPNQKNELFIQDTSNVNLEFSIVRKEGALYKVIYSGKATGYKSGSNYYYRFNFENFIRIDDLSTTVTHVDEYHAYILGNNESDITLCLGNIFTSSTSMLDIMTNGEVYLKPQYTPVDLIATKFYYVFKDKIDGTGYFKPSEVIPSTWYPITLYSGQLNFSIIATNGTVLKGDGITVPAGYSYIVAFLKLPASFRSIQFAYNTIDITEVYATNKCVDPIYYFGESGEFGMVNCTGVSRRVETTAKEQIGKFNGILFTKNITNKQIVQNTGFGIPAIVIYNLIKAPVAYKIVDNNLKKYIIENESFNGYTNVKLGDRNVELTLTDTKNYKRITNKAISFFD